eukprot:TRINITY_DN23526_c0_g2_i1.p1 TRINITY_DN23526_c0_g2~~TRINITY_DN23526_c0_g2_i1.p1  ORF type:complete len:464 (+),score=63.92 TRINITY_DN23526_c0_g2_i1:644-2035(+)
MLRLMAAFALFVRSGTAQEALSLEFPSSSPASLSLNDGIKQLLEFATSMHPEMGLPEPMASAGRRLLQVPTALGDPGFANEFNEEDLPGRFNKVMEDLKSVVHGARARAEKDNILDVPAAKHARSYLDLEKRLLKDSGLNITDDSEPMPHVAAERNSTASEDVHVLWGAQAGLAKKSPENAYRKQKMKDFNRARCGGLIIQATLFAAEFGIQVTGAVESCGNVTSVVRQRMCTRQIFVSMRAITQIVKDALTAYGDCNDSKNTACAATVTNTFARAMYLGEYGARMALLCTQENFAENRRTALGCGLRLELFAWQIGPFSGDLAKAARVCVANPDYGKPLRQSLRGVSRGGHQRTEYRRQQGHSSSRLVWRLPNPLWCGSVAAWRRSLQGGRPSGEGGQEVPESDDEGREGSLCRRDQRSTEVLVCLRREVHGRSRSLHCAEQGGRPVRKQHREGHGGFLLHQ